MHFNLELSVKKINTSLNLERDMWVSANGGSFQRELKGLVVNSIVGVRYHWKLKNEKRLRFGLYHYNIRAISASVAKRWDVEIRHIKPYRGETGYNAQRTSVGIIHRL
ncbi:MAG: hypothetical protein LH618_17385 [Saprospiraceae bacterium]|nr:hypothetical protein [Saprospiraceae bacterium]